MAEYPIFVSVGTPSNEEQERFVRAVEDRLRGEGLIPHTIGRNTFDSDAPLKMISKLMDRCAGTVVIALERSFFPEGVERRDSTQQKPISDIRLPTCWNQIEAGMAYSRNHPLLVIVEQGLKYEGLLERGYDWYVQTIPIAISSLSTVEFNGVLAGWKQKVADYGNASSRTNTAPDPDALTIRDLILGLSIKQLWGASAAVVGLLVSVFLVGIWIGKNT